VRGDAGVSGEAAGAKGAAAAPGNGAGARIQLPGEAGAGRGIAAHHALLARWVRSVLPRRWQGLAAAAELEGLVATGTVAVLGAHALQQAGPRTPLDLVLIPPQPAGAEDPLTPSALDGLLTEGELPLGWRVRGRIWLRRQLGDPEGLWLWQHAAVIADPAGQLAAEIPVALGGFRSQLPQLIAQRYGWLRTGLEKAGEARDVLGRALLLARAAGAALQLPLLARGEPYPPPQWLSWQLVRVCPQGEEIVQWAHQLTRASGDCEVAGMLRRTIDELLEVSGYGETLVRQYWRRA